MRTRVVLLAVVVSVAGMAGAAGEAQQAPTSPRRSSVSTRTDQAFRTPWGDPDLQGIWDYSSPTPMERPAALANKAFLTEEEAAALDRQGAEQAARARAEAGREAWWEAKGTRPGGRRTSLVTTPDGKIPSLTPEAKKSLSEQAALIQAPPGGPEDRSVTERCIKGFNSGPPMDPHNYNNLIQIFQAPGQVAILNENIHKARIVPLDGRPHTGIHQWAGDPRGRWEGNTLVVDTTNFRGPTSFKDSGPNLHLIERFTRVDRDTLRYEFTVDDPTTWTRPWSAEIPMTRTNNPIYEFACHEGNSSMVGMLAGSRADERAAKAKDPSPR